ncbi:MAG: J domain-containing protein [Kofleriaceae bacterium]
MSITRRIWEGAQTGFSKLSSLVIVDDDPLSHVESAALQAELTARKAARAATRNPLDNPLAKLALGNPGARAQRDRAAQQRAGKVHRERDEREQKQKQAADDAFRRMKEQAAKGGTWTPPPSSSTSSGSSNPRPPRPGSNEAQVAEWYRVLDLQPGAEMSQIKSSYRQLMRKYHPDMHAGNPSKQKAATELSMRVTTAYNGLVAHLDKK